jgi:hypothetical protein
VRTGRERILAVQITALGMLLGASLYEQLVNVPNCLEDIPQSLEEARLFWSSANPRNYFRVVAPVAQISALISLILGCVPTSARYTWPPPSLSLSQTSLPSHSTTHETRS